MYSWAAIWVVVPRHLRLARTERIGEEPTSIPDQFAALAARLGRTRCRPGGLRGQVHDALRGGPSLLLLLRLDYPDLLVDIGGISHSSYPSAGEASVRR